MTQPPATRSSWALLATLLLAAAALRIGGASGEPWVDEIWSLEIAHQADSALALLASRHDNNHLLNSAYLRLLTADAGPLALRGATLLAAFASLLVVARIGAERSRGDAATALLLFGVAYPFVLYGSEARGYGQVVLFALLAYWALGRHLRQPRPWSAALVSACGVLGPLAHLTYAHFTLGALLWSGLVWKRSGLSGRRIAWELARCHALPVAAVAALYFGFARGMTIGGGPHYGLGYALARSAALLLGTPDDPSWLLPALVNAGALTLVALVWLGRRDRDEALGLGLLGLAAPALLVALVRPELLYPRYFLVSLSFVLLAWARLLAGLLAAGGGRRAIACAGLAAFAGLHLVHDLELARVGRSRFGAALERVRRDARAPVIPIAVDADPISAALLRFHAGRLGPGPRLRGFPADRIPEGGVAWLLGLQTGPADPAPERRDRHGNRYHLERVEPAARESGFPVAVYRREH